MFAVSVRRTESNPRTAGAIRARGGRLTVSQAEIAKREREQMQQQQAAALAKTTAAVQKRMGRKWRKYLGAVMSGSDFTPAIRYRPKFRTILARLCNVYGFSADEICSKSRRVDVVLARQAICYWAYRLTNLSLVAIGRRLGDRHHATVLHAVMAYCAKRRESGRHLREVRRLP